MAPVLTLHQGEETADYVPHPIEVARQLLMDAAGDEGELVASELRLLAASLPRRAPIRKEGAYRRIATIIRGGSGNAADRPERGE
jgi:hypothetical protein